MRKTASKKIGKKDDDEEEEGGEGEGRSKRAIFKTKY